MQRFFGVCGVLAAALAVAVPIGGANDAQTAATPPSTNPAAECGRTVVGGRIARLGVDGLLLRRGGSEGSRGLAVKLTADTVIKQGDAVVGRSALAVGKRARIVVRGCRSGDRREITALVITLAPGSDNGETKDPPATTEPPKTEPKPAPATCGQGETNAMLVSSTTTSVTLKTSSAEGIKEWTVTVDGDTVVRKNDQNVGLGELKAGDYVHVVIVRCPSGSARALRIVFLQAAAQPVV